MAVKLEKIWYHKHLLSEVLRPMSWIYQGVSTLRRYILSRWFQTSFSVPIIVVGNLSVGGVGKTPLVVALAQFFQKKGLKVGVVSRGYGATISEFPHDIQAHESATLVGDEPKLIAQATGAPVVIDPKRVRAVEFLISKYQPDIILSDDGLQHYKMGRSIEIAVVDATRGLGNGYCLPAGPLREPPARLQEVDFIVANSGSWPSAFSMSLKPIEIIALSTGKVVNRDVFNEPIAAFAGIGNPQRFYSTLNELGIHFVPYDFPDHHVYNADDFRVQEKQVIMTEKDAVKCQSFCTDQMFYLKVQPELSDAFWRALQSHQRLQGCFSYEI